MQIVSEAVFEKLKEHPIQYHNTHNRIAYTTNNELVIRQIEIHSKANTIKLKSSELITFCLDNNNYIALLYTNGLLEIRKIDKPS